MQKKTTVYAIYTSEEKVVMHHLLRQLKSLKEDPNVEIWYDDSIKSGQTWKPSDKSRLYDADIFLLLVSNTFMYSEFIKQLEFKIIIDRYKSGKAKVIPLILENCPWDIDFEANEYTFNFNELHVLPVVNKPISTWDSAENALSVSAKYIKSIINSLADGSLIAESEEIDEKVTVAALSESDIQLAIPLEEDVIQEIITDERELIEELEIERPSEEENKLHEEAIEEIRIQEENWFHERMESSPETIVDDKVAYYDEQEEIAQVENTINKKRVLFGIAATALVIAGLIWFFPSDQEASDEMIPQDQSETIVGNDTNKNQSNTTLGAGASLSTSGTKIGNTYKGGIIFQIDKNNEDGIIAHLKDTEPMTWNDAMKIHEKLGEGWRLPTLVELKKMHKNIGQGANNSGKFTDGLYWSATPYDSNQARLIRFKDGNTTFHYNSIGTFRKFPVRAVRDFSN